MTVLDLICVMCLFIGLILVFCRIADMLWPLEYHELDALLRQAEKDIENRERVK